MFMYYLCIINLCIILTGTIIVQIKEKCEPIKSTFRCCFSIKEKSLPVLFNEFYAIVL